MGTYHFVNSVFNGAGGSRLVDTIADPSADEQNVYNSILRNTSESVVCYRANKVHQCRHVGTISPESDIVGSSQITSAQFDSIFPNWAAGDYRVAADSLLVQDLGVDRSADANGIAHDIIGTARPQGAAWDLGPEEYLSPSQPVDPDNTVTIVGGITDPNSLFADLTGGDTLSWKLSDDSTVTANVTLDAEGYPVFDTADAYDEVEVTYNIQPLGGGWGLPKFWTADLTKVQAADPANKITAVAGITDEKSLFEGLSGGEVVSWTSPTTGVVADVTIDAEGFPVFSNVPEQGGQAVFIYNWESSDGAGDWGSLYSYTAILTPPAAVDPLHTIQARTGITDPKSIFQQDEVAITGNERFSWSDATGDVTADVDIDVDGFPVFSNHSGLGECTFIYNYETSIGAGDWSDAGTYTAELLDPQAVDPNNLHTVTDLTYIDDPECIYHDLTPPTAIGDIFSWQSPTPKDGSTVTIDAQGFPVIDSGGALGMDSFRYNRDVGGQGFWTTPGVWTYELRAGSGPFVDVHVVTDISMANDVNCIYHNADDPGTPLAQVGSVISFMPESEVYDWAVDIDAQGFPVITNDNEYGPDSFRFSVDFDGDDNWDTPITWHFTTINPAATLTNPRVDEDTITTGGAKVYVTSDKAGGVIYAAHRTDRPWYQDEQTDIEMNAFDTVTSVEGENEFTADNLDPVTGYYYGFAQE